MHHESPVTCWHMVAKSRHIHYHYSWTMSIWNNLTKLPDLLLQYRTESSLNINQTIIILSLHAVWIVLILTWDTYEGENKKCMSDVNNVTCTVQQTHIPCLSVHLCQWMPTRQWGTKSGIGSTSHYITLLQCIYLCSSHKFTSFFLL